MKGAGLLGQIGVGVALLLLALLGEGTGFPTGMATGTSGQEGCGLNATCFAANLANCSNSSYTLNNNTITLEFSTLQGNSTHCIVKGNIKNSSRQELIGTKEECLFPKGSYNASSFWGYYNQNIFEICNGSYIESLSPEKGESNAFLSIYFPEELSLHQQNSRLIIRAEIKANSSHLYLGEYFLGFFSGDGWKKANALKYEDYAGSPNRSTNLTLEWNSSQANISQASGIHNISLLVEANLSHSEGRISVSDTITLRVNASGHEGHQPGPDMYEPDDNMGHTNISAYSYKGLLPAGVPIERTIHYGNDTDYFHLNVSKGLLYIITAENYTNSLDLDMKLFNESGKAIDCESHRSLLKKHVAYFPAEYAGTVVVRMKGIKSTGGYSVKAVQLIDMDHDGYTPGFGEAEDCNDNSAEVRPLVSGRHIRSSIRPCNREYSGFMEGLNVTKSGISIDCSGVGVRGAMKGSLFTAMGISDIEISNCRIENFSIGIRLENCTGCSVSGSEISKGKVGIYAVGSSFRALNNTLNNNSGYGLMAERSQEFEVSSSSMEHNGYYGIIITSSEEGVVKDSAIRGNAKRGVVIEDSKGITIEDTEIGMGQECGIEVNKAEDIEIRDNNISGNSDGILIYRGREVRVKRNIIAPNNRSAVRITAESEDIRINWNRLFGSANMTLVNMQPREIDATKNYWDSEGESSIRLSILDYYDSVYYGKAAYSPWLAEPENYSALVYGTNWTECNDGIDNDIDGLIDSEDSGCTGPDDDDENITFLPQQKAGNETDEGNGTSNLGGACEEAWVCSEWGECGPDSVRSRECVDENKCGTEHSKPEEYGVCQHMLDEDLCSNGRLDRGEIMVDCGGKCGPCEKKVPVTEEPSESKGIGYALPAIIIISCIALISTAGLFIGLRGRHHGFGRGTMPGPKELPELVTPPEKKAEDYAKRCLINGFSSEDVRKKLVLAGWKPEKALELIRKSEWALRLRVFVEGMHLKGYPSEGIRQMLVSSGWESDEAAKIVEAVVARKKLETLVKKPGNGIPKSSLYRARWKHKYQLANQAIRKSFEAMPSGRPDIPPKIIKDDMKSGKGYRLDEESGSFRLRAG